MQTIFVPYKHQGVDLEAVFVCDPAHGPRPGILLCHAWRGRDDFICEKAMELAKWGYSTFALDLYGKGVLGTNKEENSRLMEPFIKDRHFLMSRLLASLDCFRQQDYVEKNRIAAIGFCFGGLCALDLARGGADLQACISVHGLLFPPDYPQEKQIKAKVLALHGHDDPMVPMEQVIQFQNEMTRANADWQMHIYGNTMHAFTHPQANDPTFGTVFNPLSAKRAWQLIQNFLSESLK